jgi:hypothetical protein
VGNVDEDHLLDISTIVQAAHTNGKHSLVVIFTIFNTHHIYCAILTVEDMHKSILVG